MIVFFSGNGNSAYVAARLSAILGEEDVLRLDKKLTGRNVLALTEKDRRIVWVCPVHAWGLPKAVSAFMETVKTEGDAVHHLVVTCGDDTGYIDREWRGIMEKRGFRAGSCRHVIMPNTYVTMPGFDVDPKKLEEKKLREAEARIEEIAAAIASGNTDTELHRGVFAHLKSGLLRSAFLKLGMNPEPFHANDACISCGICIANCPLENIAPDASGRPVWGKDCTMCLGCYNRCPRHAVQYGKITEKKGQYVCPLPLRAGS